MINNVKQLLSMDGLTLVGYRVTWDNSLIADVPIDEANKDYSSIIEWLAEGNTPEPAE